MNRKRRIREKHIAKVSVATEMTIEGIPMIYSVKIRAGERKFNTQHLRNMQWKSILKCTFKSYYMTTTRIVLFVRFYVPVPSYVNLSPQAIASEQVPAVESFEICDYLLSFMEMLSHVLVSSYRQFVKIDAEKYYSDNPRTVFKFMKWEHYEEYKNHAPLHTKTKSISASREIQYLQSESEWHGVSEGVCEEGAGEEADIPQTST